MKEGKKPRNYSRLIYNGTEHKCSTRYGLCYWTDLEIAKQECSEWKECHSLYGTDRSLPAVSGTPVYWAFRSGKLLTSNGDIVWKKKTPKL